MELSKQNIEDVLELVSNIIGDFAPSYRNLLVELIKSTHANVEAKWGEKYIFDKHKLYLANKVAYAHSSIDESLNRHIVETESVWKVSQF